MWFHNGNLNIFAQYFFTLLLNPLEFSNKQYYVYPNLNTQVKYSNDVLVITVVVQGDGVA